MFLGKVSKAARERAWRLVYNDYDSSFNELLQIPNENTITIN